MTENEILIKVAETLDDTVTTLKIKTKKLVVDVLPKYKLFGFGFGKIKTENIVESERVLAIKPATLRTMIRISRLLLSTDVKPMPDPKDYIAWALEAVSTNGYLQAEIIAVAIHNSREEMPADILELILDNFTAEDLWKVAQVVLDKLNIVPFMNTITSIKSAQVLQPMESLEKKEEIIASLEQSEALSNILGSATIIR
jgi:hypothetical protein